MTPEMVDVKNKQCLCGRARAYFGVVGGNAVCCKRCMTSGMVDLKNKRCRCGKAIPYFGAVGCNAVCCMRCKTPDMINCRKTQRSPNSYEKNAFRSSEEHPTIPASHRRTKYQVRLIL